MSHLVLLSILWSLAAHNVDSQVQVQRPGKNQLPRELGTTVRLSDPAGRLDVIAAEISRQTRLAVLLDDEPPAIAVAIDLRGTAEEVLDRVSQLYGYTWTAGTSGAVILRKAFQKPDQSPQIHVDDALQVAADVTAIVERFGEPPGLSRMGNVLRTLISSLNSSQAKLVQENKVIPVRALEYSQRQLVMLATYHVLLGRPHEAFDLLNRRLGNLDSMVVSAFPGVAVPLDGFVLPERLQTEWSELGKKQGRQLLQYGRGRSAMAGAAAGGP